MKPLKREGFVKPVFVGCVIHIYIWSLSTDMGDTFQRPLGVSRGFAKPNFLVRNCMKCPDLQWKVCFQPSLRWWNKGDGISFHQKGFNLELNEISRSTQKSHVSHTASLWGRGTRVKFQKHLLEIAQNIQICTERSCLPNSASIGLGGAQLEIFFLNCMKCPDPHRKVMFANLHP